jgi:hypothetical protein
MSMAVSRVRHQIVPWAACLIVAGTAAVWAGHAAWAAFENRRTPSCSWALRIHGKPAPAQARLVRCYLRALAHRDTAGLLAVAANIPPVRITKSDLAHSADARTGRATATFLPADVDTAFVPVIITYADGATDRLGIQNMVAMGGPSLWRMAIGADVNHNQGPPGPSPAQSRPPGPSPATGPTTANGSR